MTNIYNLPSDKIALWSHIAVSSNDAENLVSAMDALRELLGLDSFSADFVRFRKKRLYFLARLGTPYVFALAGGPSLGSLMGLLPVSRVLSDSEWIGG